MAEKQMTKDEIKAFLLWYQDNLVREYVHREEIEITAKQFKQYGAFLDSQEPEALDAMEEIVRENPLPEGCHYMLKRNRTALVYRLIRAGRCPDIAREEAKYFMQPLHFTPKEYQMELRGYEWSEADEEHTKRWLMCECDDLPAVIPAAWVEFHYFLDEIAGEHFMLLGNLFDFPLRYTAYVYCKCNRVDELKYVFRPYLISCAEGTGDRILAQIREMAKTLFHMTDEEFEILTMQWFALIYCVGPKKKQETQFYKKFIDGWMEQDKDRFLDVIQTKSSKEARKKILKKLFPDVKPK